MLYNSEEIYKTFMEYEYTNEFGLQHNFIKDFFEYTRKDFIRKYRHLPYQYETRIDKVEYSDGYCDLRGVEYYRVPSTERWRYNVEDKNSEIDKVSFNEREDMFLIDARNFLKIGGSRMTKEIFVYDMVKLIDKFYENEDGGLTNEYIIGKCKEVWDYYYMVNNHVEVKKKLFKIDKDYWINKGYNNWLEVCSIIKSKMKTLDISSLWNDQLTLEENIEEFKNYGVSTTKKTVIKWLDSEGKDYITNAQKQRNIRNKVVIEVYLEDKSRSSREIERIVKERGYDISYKTIQPIVNEYNKQHKEEKKTIVMKEIKTTSIKELCLEDDLFMERSVINKSLVERSETTNYLLNVS